MGPCYVSVCMYACTMGRPKQCDIKSYIGYCFYFQYNYFFFLGTTPAMTSLTSLNVTVISNVTISLYSMTVNKQTLVSRSKNISELIAIVETNNLSPSHTSISYTVTPISIIHSSLSFMSSMPIDSKAQMNNSNSPVQKISSSSATTVLQQSSSSFPTTSEMKEMTVFTTYTSISVGNTTNMSSKTVSSIASLKSTMSFTAYSTGMKSDTTSFVTSPRNSSKLSSSATNSFVATAITEIVSTPSSVLHTKTSSVAIVNVTHISDTEIFKSISSSSYLSSSSTVDFTSTASIVPVGVGSVTSMTVLSSMSSRILFSTSSYFSNKTDAVIPSGKIILFDI